ncbi:MAG: division/cell wall cluster transcriptional repressor MraZ [Verrucomicrobiota bacterium JB024]|jgi:MraZ protein|nr:division/cell wall cluster transcriptional repressor MraZ [Verrucomicrobiota bacterium JB024]
MIPFDQGLYAGEHRHNLDAKKRLTVPSKWRFDGDENALYLAFADPSGCVTVYPPKMVEQLKARLSSISLGDKKGQRAIMRLLGQSDQFTFDKNGRINLNERLYRHAGIEKEVVLVGTVNKFHLWEPERYEAYIEADEDEGDLSDILSDLGL